MLSIICFQEETVTGLFKGVTGKDLILIVAAAVLTALFTQLVTWIYNEYISWRTRSNIKGLIIEDLIRLRVQVLILTSEYRKLIEYIDKNHIGNIDVEMFTELHTDVYHSIPLTSIYESFKGSTLSIMKIYKNVTYLISHVPFSIADKLEIIYAQNTSIEVKKKDLDRFKINLNHHIDTITETVGLIDSFTTK